MACTASRIRDLPRQVPVDCKHVTWKKPKRRPRWRRALADRLSDILAPLALVVVVLLATADWAPLLERLMP